MITIQQIAALMAELNKDEEKWVSKKSNEILQQVSSTSSFTVHFTVQDNKEVFRKIWGVLLENLNKTPGVSSEWSFSTVETGSLFWKTSVDKYILQVSWDGLV